MVITYSGLTEVLVCTSDMEPALIQEYFEEGGRDKDDYDREVHKEPVQINTSLRVR